LDKRLPELVKYTRSNLKNSWIRIYTNGDFLTKPLFDKLVASGVNEFYVTGHDGFKPKNIEKLERTKFGSKMMYFQKINNKIDPLFNRGGLVGVKKRIKFDKCLLASNNLVIDFKGNVILCCNDYLSRYKFGDINKEKIVDIWRKDKYKKIRNDVKNGKFNLDICKICAGN
jgi:radical SAM protein with 4Fe4S-binding SPASM domain